MDSASSQMNFAFPYDINLEDQLFRYGVRINNDLILDNQAARTPVVVGYAGDEPQIQMMPWPFFPLMNRYGEHPISRNLDASYFRFVSTIDTVKAPGVKKTPLIFTSDYTMVVSAPVKVTVNDLRKNLEPDKFNQKNLPVAYLLEGAFTSIFKNRFLPDGVEKSDYLEEGTSKLVVISDGDYARNYLDPSTGQPLELGYDPYLKNKFGNEDFLMNALAYLVEEDGIIQARSKEITVRPLDKVEINKSRLKWQVINIVVPIIMLLITGLIIYYYRKRKYANF
jgi:ABC-2 type transport system permease protein